MVDIDGLMEVFGGYLREKRDDSILMYEMCIECTGAMNGEGVYVLSSGS